MKRFLGILMVSFVFCVSGASFAGEDDYSKEDSLVLYHYKDADGKEKTTEVGAYKYLPDDLKQKEWDCWVDYNGWYNCEERKN